MGSAAGNTRWIALEHLLGHTLGGLGLELTDLELSNHGSMLRVFIDKKHEDCAESSEGVTRVTLADCETASRQLQRVLEVEGIGYGRLEVSSPGLDRKLKKAADFVRFAGQKADVRLREPVNGRRRFVGVVRRVMGEQVELEVDGAMFVLALENLDKARLVPRF